MHKKFDHENIEKKWQKSWKEAGLYNVGERDARKEKEYVLIEWPYPSGNLHIGHWFAFAVVDIYVRAKRMEGKQVMFPMGFDAFGLPAENAAIKRGLDPKGWTDSNVAFMKEQLTSMGNAFSWDKTTSSTDPDYYAWTQWMFTEFLKNDIAYRGKGKVNWCPGCNTVLANEQVLPNGTCERSGDVVEQRDMTQWMLRITQYADRLIDDLTKLDWPEHIKDSQRNWIGRSKGARLSFALTLPAFSGEIVFATNNAGKVERMRKLAKAAGLNITIKTPEEIGIHNFKVEENQPTLEKNVEKKARELSKLTDLPVFAGDTGFYIEGSELNPITVKRNALGGKNESDFTVEEVGELMANYYKEVANRHGGSVRAHWKNALCFAVQGHVKHTEGIRPVVLTNEIHGTFDPHLPLRSMYKSLSTGKYISEQTEEEELLELKPIRDALVRLLTPTVEVFTTRPDTLFGATYLVLAPEHPWVTLATDDNHDVLENKDEVKAYLHSVRTKNDIERGDATREKTGIEIKGVKAINPASGEEIPIFVSDYVIGTYGTGALMGVPAHDERDFEFAKKFELPIKEVVARHFLYTGLDAPREGVETLERDVVDLIIEHPSDGTFLVQKEVDGTRVHCHFVGGGTDGETHKTAIARELEEETGFSQFEIIGGLAAKTSTHGYRHTKKKNGKTKQHFYHIKLKSLDQKPSEIEKGLHTVEWMPREKVVDALTWECHMQAWQYFLGKRYHEGTGKLYNSGEFDDMDSEEAKGKITEFVGGTLENTYRLRDWSIGRQRYWGVPIPVVYDSEGNAHPIPKEHLPWHLPTDVDHTPTGEPPLSKSQELRDRVTRIFGEGWTPDYETMDTFVDSSWYFLRYLDNRNDTELSTLKAQEDWMPVDIYFGGAEHTTMHLLYSRFWQKALFDLGLVTVDEPYKKRINRGLVLGPDGNKMSKSKGNVIDPDEQVKRLGADTVKMYLAFMGPYGESTSYPWDMGGIVGIRRFLERVYGLREHVSESETEETGRLLHKSIKKVRDDIHQYKFNTAISTLMIFINHAEKVGLTSSSYQIFLRLLAPFAPHVTEELWYEAGEDGSVHTAVWPTYDPKEAEETEVIVGVQINGKMRGTISLLAHATEEEALNRVASNPSLKVRLEGGVKKVIYVPGRILSIVTDSMST